MPAAADLPLLSETTLRVTKFKPPHHWQYATMRTTHTPCASTYSHLYGSNLPNMKKAAHPSTQQAVSLLPGSQAGRQPQMMTNRLLKDHITCYENKTSGWADGPHHSLAQQPWRPLNLHDHRCCQHCHIGITTNKQRWEQGSLETHCHILTFNPWQTTTAAAAAPSPAPSLLSCGPASPATSHPLRCRVPTQRANSYQQAESNPRHRRAEVVAAPYPTPPLLPSLPHPQPHSPLHRHSRL